MILRLYKKAKSQIAVDRWSNIIRRWRVAEYNKSVRELAEHWVAGWQEFRRQHIELMRLEGLPLVWGKAGILLTIVALKDAGEYASAARWAAQGAKHAHEALGADSSTYSQFTRLASVFGKAAGLNDAGDTTAPPQNPTEEASLA